MKFSCDAMRLKKGLDIAKKAITGKASTPILSGIYLSVQDNVLTLRGSDLSLTVETKLEVKGEASGAVLVNAKLLSDLMGKLNGEIVVYEEAQEVFVQFGSNIYNMPKMNANDFPDFPQIDVENKIELSNEAFKDLVYMTEFACATDESRPLFTGILVEVKEGKITFVGTNTHRLAIKSKECNAESFSCVIPAKVMNEICNILSAGGLSTNIVLGVLNNQIIISVDNTVLITRLLDGRFPDYHKVIPQSFTLSVQVNREDLIGNLERVVLFSKVNDHSTVKFQFKENRLLITAKGIDIGSAKEELSCEMEGNELEIAFNAAYIADVLKHSTAEKITFKLNSSLTPGIIENGDTEFIYIITPVRVL